MTSPHEDSPSDDAAPNLPWAGGGGRGEEEEEGQEEEQQGEKEREKEGETQDKGKGRGRRRSRGEAEEEEEGQEQQGESFQQAQRCRKPLIRGDRIHLRPRSGFALADGPERGSRAWGTQAEPPRRSLGCRACPDPLPLQSHCHSLGSSAQDAALPQHRRQHPPPPPPTGTHPGDNPGQPSPTGNPLRSWAPLRPLTRALSPSPSRGSNSSSERGNWEGGGRVTSATRALSPGRRGQRGTGSRALCQAWPQPEHPRGCQEPQPRSSE